MKRLSKVVIIFLLCISFVSCSSNFLERILVVGNATIEIPEFISEKQEEVSESQIEWFLASSNEWNLIFQMSEDGLDTVKGSKNQIGEDRRGITINIYLENFTENDEHPQEFFDLSAGNQDHVIIKLYKLNTGENYYTNLVFRLSDNLYVQFIESSPDKSRTLTMEAFQSLSTLFLPYAEQYALLKQNGSIRELEEPNLSAIRNVYGEYIIKGFVHTERANRAWIKVLDSETGELYYNQFDYENEQFLLGWSDNESDYFYFSQELIVPIPFYGKGPKNANVIVQLWVEETGGTSYCAVSSQLDMEFWER